MTDAPKTIYQRMADVATDAAGLEFVKSKFVEVTKAKGDEPAKGYYIIPISDILKPLRELYGKHGLFIMPSPIKYDPSNAESKKEVKVGQYQTPTWLANGHVDFTLYSVEGETIETSISCEAKETVGQDKLTNKLYTNAIRNYLRIVHMIDGDEAQDPEEINGATVKTPEDYTPTEEVPTKEQRAEAVKRDSFFGAPAKKEPKAQPADREAMLKEIKEITTKSTKAHTTARIMKGDKTTYFDLTNDELKAILDQIRGL